MNVPSFALFALLLLVEAGRTTAQGTQQHDANLFSGISPPNTVWTQEAPGTISTLVAIPSHLQFPSVPTYFTRITYRGSGFVSQFDALAELGHLANVTGASIPRSATATSFKIRLEGRNLTKTLATVSDFRVVWVAASPKYPPLREKSGIEAHVAMLKRYLLEEDPVLVRALLDGYQPMARNIPKPVPPPPPPKKNNKTSTSSSSNGGEKPGEELSSKASTGEANNSETATE